MVYAAPAREPFLLVVTEAALNFSYRDNVTQAGQFCHPKVEILVTAAAGSTRFNSP